MCLNKGTQHALRKTFLLLKGDKLARHCIEHGDEEKEKAHFSHANFSYTHSEVFPRARGSKRIQNDVDV